MHTASEKMMINTAFSAREVQTTLSRTHAILDGLTAHASPDALVFREAPGTWNALEILSHVTDGEITDWMPRVRIVLAASGDRRFTPFDREGGFVRYRGWSAAALLAEFATLRARNLTELDGLRITPEQLRLEGLHPEFGAVTLQQLLATWVTHDLAHVAQLARVLVRYTGRDVGPWAKYFSLLRGHN
jgi:hypothetical protein